MRVLYKNIVGKVEAVIYTIEFQKRGLPHAHILLTLNEQVKIVNATDIDEVVFAEIPNIQTHPTLYEYVVKHMMHVPCWLLNPNSVCIKDGKCIKHYPKQFNEFTCESVNGYPLYWKRDNVTHALVVALTIGTLYHTIHIYLPNLIAI